MRQVKDTTGRFQFRPHYSADELDQECEELIRRFLKGLHGDVRFPIDTEDLKKLIERDADDLDVYADLSAYGPDVEGLTEFFPRRRPKVSISASLTESEARENRLRTTLTHEYGHVHFHRYLFDDSQGPGLLNTRSGSATKIVCKRDSMLSAGQVDWMEWQAGYACGALLMPKTAIRKVSLDHAERHGTYGPVSLSTEAGRMLLAEVRLRFGVSDEAARIRLLKLRLVIDSPQSSLI